MCTFGNNCMTVGYRRRIMQMVVGVGQSDNNITDSEIFESWQLA